jgi:hypothetical protein
MLEIILQALNMEGGFTESNCSKIFLKVIWLLTHHYKVMALLIDFSLLHRVQTGSGAHQASCPVGTGRSFPGGKATNKFSLKN